MSINDQKYWNEYYQKSFIIKPSPFAKFCQDKYLESPKRMIELGSGSGRDLCYFFQCGHQVTGFDASAEAVTHVRREWPEIDYQVADFTQMEAMSDIDVVYSRWTLHSVDAESEKSALRWTAESLVSGGLFLVEVRTINDHLYGVGEKVGLNSFQTDHFRRFIVPEEFVDTLSSMGFEVVYHLESSGLSVYKGDDPVLLRIVAKKQ